MESFVDVKRKSSKLVGCHPPISAARSCRKMAPTNCSLLCMLSWNYAYSSVSESFGISIAMLFSVPKAITLIAI